MYTTNDVQRLINGIDLGYAITAKKAMQQQMLLVITNEERSLLARDILSESLIKKVKDIGRKYCNSTNDSVVLSVAMAVGTILKELDNMNLEYVSYQSVAEIMNYIKH